MNCTRNCGFCALARRSALRLGQAYRAAFGERADGGHGRGEGGGVGADLDGTEETAEGDVTGTDSVIRTIHAAAAAPAVFTRLKRLLKLLLQQLVCQQQGSGDYGVVSQQ